MPSCCLLPGWPVAAAAEHGSAINGSRGAEPELNPGDGWILVTDSIWPLDRPCPIAASRSLRFRVQRRKATNASIRRRRAQPSIRPTRRSVGRVEAADRAERSLISALKQPGLVLAIQVSLSCCFSARFSGFLHNVDVSAQLKGATADRSGIPQGAHDGGRRLAPRGGWR